MANVEIVTSGQTTEITGKDGKVDGLVLKDRQSGEECRIELEGVFVQIGLVPNTEWLQSSGLELTKFGEIVTDEEGRTNLPGVFGAGDVTDVPYKQHQQFMAAVPHAARPPMLSPWRSNRGTRHRSRRYKATALASAFDFAGAGVPRVRP